MKNNFSIIKEYRKQKGMTQKELSNLLNVSQGTVSGWEHGLWEPDSKSLLKMSEIFNCTIDNLLGKSEMFSKIDFIFEQANKASHAKIPVYGTIPAGIPAEMIDDRYIEDYEDISETLLKSGAKYFGLKVKGESMMPEFRPNDTLIIKQQDDCNSGEFCAVSINHTECTFKKVIKKENGITLQPLNPNFEPMFFTNEEIEKLPITILGVIKETRRSY